jgi:DNA repair protein RecO (recombination protein O)
MIERGSGVILRTRPLTETSLIVQWLTAEHGRISMVAKGARRAKSPFAGKLDLFYEGEFSFVRSRRSELHTLGEVAIRETNQALRRDLLCLRQAAYCAALLEQTTETETPLPGVFELFKGVLRQIAAAPPQPRTVFAFELKLLRELGLEPELQKTHLSAAAKRLVQDLAETDWSDLAQLKPAQAPAVELRRFLHGFLIYHLEKLPRGRSEALKTESA